MSNNNISHVTGTLRVTGILVEKQNRRGGKKTKQNIHAYCAVVRLGGRAFRTSLKPKSVFFLSFGRSTVSRRAKGSRARFGRTCYARYLIHAIVTIVVVVVVVISFGYLTRCYTNTSYDTH